MLVVLPHQGRREPVDVAIRLRDLLGAEPRDGIGHRHGRRVGTLPHRVGGGRERLRGDAECARHERRRAIVESGEPLPEGPLECLGEGNPVARLQLLSPHVDLVCALTARVRGEESPAATIQ